MSEHEIWKIVNFKDIEDIYMISNFGRVKNIRKGKIYKDM